MKEVKNCSRCGMVFATDEGYVFCKLCARAEEPLLKKIREFVYDHPGTTAYELSSQFNMSIGKVKIYMKHLNIRYTN